MDDALAQAGIDRNGLYHQIVKHSIRRARKIEDQKSPMPTNAACAMVGGGDREKRDEGDRLPGATGRARSDIRAMFALAPER